VATDKKAEKKDESKTTGLTSDQLKAAAEAMENRTLRPAGVSYNPYRSPQFLSESEEAEYDRTGVMPKSATDRVEEERKIVGHFDYAGNRLDPEVVAEGYRTGQAVEAQGTSPVSNPVEVTSAS
jgi:hypothetical protein